MSFAAESRRESGFRACCSCDLTIVHTNNKNTIIVASSIIAPVRRPSETSVSFYTFTVTLSSSLTLASFLRDIFLADFALIRRSGSFGNSYWRNIEVYGHLFRRYEKGLPLAEISEETFHCEENGISVLIKFRGYSNFIVFEPSYGSNFRKCSNRRNCEKMKIQEFEEKSISYVFNYHHLRKI